MGQITAARAYANNEVAFVAWTLDENIPDCLGFEITRFVTGEEPRVLPAWVPFKGQSNPDWIPQTTSVWPIQRLMWRDLTVRKRRDATSTHPADIEVRYRIRALVKRTAGLEPVPGGDTAHYEGKPVSLSYADDGVETNTVVVTGKYGNVTSAFTNGMLSAQWLKNALESDGETLTEDNVRRHMQEPGDPIRGYLAGDVIETLTYLLKAAANDESLTVYLALYELGDKELMEHILNASERVHIILSNSGKDDDGNWDAGNAANRELLSEKLDDRLTSRFFNNNHIGHNKFAVLVRGETPEAVMTGSTNWTSTGLCGQSNNAVIIEDADLARTYLDYWHALKTDTEDYEVPDPTSASTSNKQGKDLRDFGRRGGTEVTLQDGKTRVTTWFSPNTPAAKKGDETPPDLSMVFSLMRKAKDAIFFAAFLPSRSGLQSIIREAADLGIKDRSLLVYGSVSDPTAMPNYEAPPRVPAGQPKPKSPPPPNVYDDDNVHIVRASALNKSDIVGEFEAELLKVGHAIIHDKIVVVDPLSEDGVIILGSHNLGYKASYENDENLLIIRGNPALTRAYMVHILDVYEHYRFRAVQQERKNQHKSQWDGFLSVDDHWLKNLLQPENSLLSRYLSGE